MRIAAACNAWWGVEATLPVSLYVGAMRNLELFVAKMEILTLLVIGFTGKGKGGKGKGKINDAAREEAARKR